MMKRRNCLLEERIETSISSKDVGEAVGLTKIVPFLLEDALKANGALYSKVENWAPYAVEDGLLITGQNPASSKLVAIKLLEQLNK